MIKKYTLLFFCFFLTMTTSYGSDNLTSNETSSKQVLTSDVTNPDCTIQCQDITIALDDSCEVQLQPEQLLGGTNNGFLYALTADNPGGIDRYYFESENNDLVLDDTYFSNLGLSYDSMFSIAIDPTTQIAYFLGGLIDFRGLYTLDLNDPEPILQLLLYPTSATGENSPIKMTFDNQGNLYFLYLDGEINKFDLVTLVMSPFVDASSINTLQGGDPSLTFDKDENRLLVGVGGSPAQIIEIPIATAIPNVIFEFIPAISCTTQAMEYVGDGKCILSSGELCKRIYLIDLNGDDYEIEVLIFENLQTNIKDFHFVEEISTSDCTIPLTYDINPPILTCDDVGENTVTITVTDGDGHVSSCSSTVTILAPLEITCQDITVELSEEGLASISPEDILVETPEVAAIDVTTFTCEDIGEVVVTVSVTQGEQLGSCSAIVTVVDTMNPQLITCVDDFAVGVDVGETVYILEDFTGVPVFSDNCTTLTKEQSPPIGTSYTAGETIDIVITATDDSGNVSEACTFTVTVEEPCGPEIAPGLFTGEYYILQLIPGAYSDQYFSPVDTPIELSEVMTVPTPYEPSEPLEINQRSFNAEYVGTLNEDFTYIMEFDTCTGNVTFSDIEVTDANCIAPVLIGPESEGGEFDPTDDSEFILVFEDHIESGCGRVSRSVQILFSREPIVPTLEITCQDITVELNENGTASVSPGDILVETLGEASIDISTFTCNDLGEVVITVTVLDGELIGECEATVTVIDTIAPLVSRCFDDFSVQVDFEDGVYILEDFRAVSSPYYNNGLLTPRFINNCGPLIIEQFPPIGTSYTVGETIDMVITATDASGNMSDACIFTITVEESCGPDIATGLFTGEYYILQLNPGVFSDQYFSPINEPIALSETMTSGNPPEPLGVRQRSFEADYYNFGVDITYVIDFDLCTNNVTFFGEQETTSLCSASNVILDSVSEGGEFDPNDDSEFILVFEDNASNGCGSSSQIVQILFSREPIVPTLEITCQDITVELNEEGIASISSSDVLVETIGEASIDISTFTCNDLGEVVVTVTVIDGQLIGECEATVTVVDTTVPLLLSCFNDTVVSADYEDGIYILEDYTSQNPNSSGSLLFDDNCTVTFEQFPAIGTPYTIGDTIGVEISAVDASGNMSETCIFTITVEESCAPDIVPSLFTGPYYIQQLTPGAFSDQYFSPTDEPIELLDINPSDPSEPLDINERSFEADYNDFGVDTPYIMAFDKCTNNVTFSGRQVTTSQCSVFDVVLDPISEGGEFDSLDDSEFILIFEDNADNGCGLPSSSVQILFSREPFLPPLEIECTDITVALDNSGVASISAEDLLVEMIGEASIDISTFTCDDLGEVVVTVTVIDGGETGVCEAIVTVVDTIEPVIIDLPSDMIVNTEIGETTYILEDFTSLVSASDNCIIDIIINQNPLPGTVFTIGDTANVVMSVTDTSGNISEERAFIVTIEEPLSIEDNLLAKEIAIYPNPTTNLFTIENRGNIELSSAILTDMRGRVLKVIDLKDSFLETLVSLENYAKGVYFLQIKSKNRGGVVKQIIKK